MLRADTQIIIQAKKALFYLINEFFTLNIKIKCRLMTD